MRMKCKQNTGYGIAIPGSLISWFEPVLGRVLLSWAVPSCDPMQVFWAVLWVALLLEV